MEHCHYCRESVHAPLNERDDSVVEMILAGYKRVRFHRDCYPKYVAERQLKKLKEQRKGWMQ